MTKTARATIKPHGTRLRYQRGCRCDKCRHAWATYFRGWRLKSGRNRSKDARALADLKATTAALQRAVANDRDAKLHVRLTPLAAGILVAVQRRTGKTRGEVVDQLLRSAPMTE